MTDDIEQRYRDLHAERAALWRLGEQAMLTPEQQARIKDISYALKQVEAERAQQRAQAGGVSAWTKPPRLIDRRR